MLFLAEEIYLGDLIFENKKLVFFFAILQAAQAPMQILGVLGLGAWVE